MIGAVTYELQVQQDGRMEGFAGRLLHGVLFRILQAYNPAFSARVHALETAKPFTVSPLIRTRQGNDNSQMLCMKDSFVVSKGTRFFWRITGLTEEVLIAALSIKPGTLLQVGHVPLTVQHCFCDGTHSSGSLSPQELIQVALESPRSREMTFHFLSPVSFRRDDLDYPMPDPQLILTSLAKKWELAYMPVRMESDKIASIAQRVAPADWKGNSMRVYFGRRYGLTGFTGIYTYSLKNLTEEEQQILKILAQFAVFSGVGRLTAQGFGQTRISWK